MAIFCKLFIAEFKKKPKVIDLVKVKKKIELQVIFEENVIMVTI